MTDLGEGGIESWDASLLASIAPDEFDRVAAEALEGLDPPLQKIALLMMEGRTQQQVAEQLGCARRTVNRKLEVIRETLGRQLQE